jgi:glycosyltransferase involved in cell wall biosynthesis
MISGRSSEKLRIAFATPEYVTENHFDGGLANYLGRVSKTLADLGHDIHVVTLSDIDEAQFEHEGVMVHRVMLKSNWQLLNRATRYRLPTTMHWLNLSSQVYRKLKQLHRHNPFHLIQYPNYSCCGFFSILFLRVPHVLRASSYQPTLNDAAGAKQNLDSRMVERLEGLQFRLSRHVYTPSYALQQMLAKEARLSHIRVIRTPFYVETQDWDNSVFERFLQGKKYLLFFGRFQLHKGIHTLARALPRVLEQYPDAYAALIGRDMQTSVSPSMAEYARMQCGSSAERLVVLENLPHRQLYPVIAGAHLVVLPSLVENLPNACLEAMGLGKVVIGTVGTSFDELITDEETGFLVAADHAVALAEKIIHAWAHPKLCEIGQAAQLKTLEFAPEKTVDLLLTYYYEILQRFESHH